AFQEWGPPGSGALDRFAEDGKAAVVISNQNRAGLESGIVCAFAFGCGDWYRKLYPAMLRAVTGIEEFADWQYLGRVGERVWNLDRSFNARDGFDRRHDTLPSRFQTEPLHTREAEGEGSMVKDLPGFLDEYYRLRGWTPNGIPTPEKLRELGLDYVVKDIEPLLKKQ
ncbi:MAG TPA: aldehyde ferredoxin oxidoreductase C-terminal domain-containing protein, partial [Dehalococcoidales bacterium]|nr:aldehyde ferredoxin oxidoreductase C-terminal domain-containing protein [Dehalococcoidales bacterium]